jgi:hypothetical protein
LGDIEIDVSLRPNFIPPPTFTSLPPSNLQPILISTAHDLPLIFALAVVATYTMASVSSLDQDMRKLRLDRYTPAAANEIRGWIEGVLGERLQSGDLMEALKDGVALCK